MSKNKYDTIKKLLPTCKFMFKFTRIVIQIIEYE